MAHEIGQLDRPMYGSNKPAWHGLGTVVEGQPTSADAMKLAGLDWTVETEPVYVRSGETTIAVPSAAATVRMDLPGDDPRRVLGIVGDRYEPIQNVEAFAIADELAGFGGARFESAGSLRNGKLVWLLATLPNQTQVKDDVVKRYLLLSTSHDGTRALQIMFTGVRVVCWNTLSMALNSAKTQASVWHVGKETRNAQLESAKEILGLAGVYFDRQAEAFDRLASTTVETRFVDRFLKAVFPDPEGERKSSRAENIRERVGDLFNGGQQGAEQEAAKGTAYGLWNAVAEYADHERTVMAFNGRAKDDARMDSVLFGSAANLKIHSAGLLGRAFNIPELVVKSPKADEMFAALMA